MTRLIVIETPEQADTLLASHGPTDRVVALNPLAEYALEHRGVASARPEQYVARSRLAAISTEGYAATERLAHVLDRAAAADSTIITAHGLRPGTYNYRALKILRDSVMLRAAALEAMLQAERPSEILACTATASRFDDRLLWGQESVSLRVLETLAREREIPMDQVAVPEGQEDDPRIGGRYLLRGGSSRFPMIARFAVLAGEAGSIPRTVLAGSRRRRGPMVLLCSRDYQVPGLAVGLVNHTDVRLAIWEPGEKLVPITRGVPVAPTPAEVAVTSAAVLGDRWKAISEADEIRGPFTSGETCFLGVAEERLRHQAVDVVQAVEQEATRSHALIDHIQPRAVVFSMVLGPRLKTIAHLARCAGAAVVVAPHGAVGFYPQPIFEHVDYRDADWYLAFGQGGVDHLTRYFGHLDLRAIAVGGPMFDASLRRSTSRRRLVRRLGIDPRRPIIVYAQTSFLGSSRTFTVPSEFTDFELYDVQRRFLTLMRRHTEVQWIVKTFPFRSPGLVSPIQRILEDRPASNIKVIDRPRFPRLLRLADAFLFDDSSTPLFDAVTTDKPIYLFDRLREWDPHAREALDARVHMDTDLDAFLTRLEVDLADGTAFKRTKRDETFRRRYVGPHPGESGRRGAISIEQIAIGTSARPSPDADGVKAEPAARHHPVGEAEGPRAGEGRIEVLP